MHRARNNGRPWTLMHQLVWLILGELHHHGGFWRGSLKIKPDKDKFKWPRTPWEDNDNSTRYGQVDKKHLPAAAKYLVGLYRKSE